MAAAQFLSIRLLGEERFATEKPARVHDGVLEHPLFEGVEGVVMDEDADGPLRRQPVTEMLDQRLQSGFEAVRNAERRVLR
jgi:hypothetical protein